MKNLSTSPDSPKAVIGRRVIRGLLHAYGHTVRLPRRG